MCGEHLAGEVRSARSPEETGRISGGGHAEDENASVPRASALECWIYAVVGPWNDGGSAVPPCTGITGAPVSAIAHRDVAAIVSPVSLDEFGPERLAATLRDAAWLPVNVLAHQQVVAWLLGHYTVAPFRFGNCCSVARVREMLTCHYEDLADTLRRLRGATEWGVKLYCDRKAAAEWVRATNAQVRRMDGEASRGSMGTGYLLQQRRERIVQQEVGCLLETHSRRSYQELVSLASEAVTDPVRPRSARGAGEEMVLNTAYLVADANVHAFRATVATLEEIARPMGFTYELTGPWPPYSFVNLVLGDFA